MPERLDPGGQVGLSGRGADQLVFVVERRQVGLDAFEHRDRCPGHRPRASDGVEGWPGHVAELAIERRHGHLGGVVAGHWREDAGRFGEGPPDCGPEDRIGERPAVVQHVGGEQLGQPERRDELDVGDATGQVGSEGALQPPGAEQAPGREPGDVRRHDDGDRREGTPGFGSHDGGAQREKGGAAVGDDVDVLDHTSNLRRRCDSHDASARSGRAGGDSQMVVPLLGSDPGV